LATAKLDSKTARLKLTPARKPYYYQLEEGFHLGYRRLKSSAGAESPPGRWVIRRYRGDGVYAVEAFAWADDAQEANGESVLTFSQAKARAREIFADRFAASEPGEKKALRVQDAIEAYLKTRAARAHSRLTRHVLADQIIAELPMRDINAEHLHDWRDRLPEELALTTVRRVSNDFRAALNAFVRKHRKTLPASLPMAIKDGFFIEETVSNNAREKQVLSDDEVRSIIAAAWEIDGQDNWDGDLARIIITLAATGTRFSQLTRMTVGDVQPANGRLMIPVSNKGHGAKASARTAVRVGQDVIEALSPALNKRKATAPLFERWRMRQVSREIDPTAWIRDRRGPWQTASEITRPWRDVIARAALSDDIVPYALRHSSIVRGLRAGLPVRLVAALHDTSSAMIEKHYSAYIVDAMDELAARAIVPLTAGAAI